VRRGGWYDFAAVCRVGALACSTASMTTADANHNTATPSGFASEILPFSPKHVVLEVFGPAGTVATINYHR